MKDTILEVKDLSVTFTQYDRGFSRRTIHAVEKMDLTVKNGEIVYVGTSEGVKDFIGEGMRLDPVTLSDEESISEIMEFYMGDNTIERQNFIRGNLRSEEELEDVNI